MGLAIVTGASGLIGSETAIHLHELGYDVWGIDNDMRAQFFGSDASTLWMKKRLQERLSRYRHFDTDIRSAESINAIFTRATTGISVIIHAAAQPSHDWAAGQPETDFTVNANGTLNLLEAARRHAPSAAFVFLSTNKVYGDHPNNLSLIELEERFELPAGHPYHRGIPANMSIDQSTHSLFGVSKAAADLLVQEYGRYFGMTTVCLRGGCITGPGHSGTRLHGFLAYLMKCAVTERPYTVFGYKGKQVRDNMHSADLVSAIELVTRAPRSGAVYNIGGGRFSNCSMLEAITLCEDIVGKPLNWSYDERNRVGDFKWWISDLSPFQGDFPRWEPRYDVPAILREIFEENAERWTREKP